jgi:signal transduction histidine kinase/ActR/RegA family two-component response regulator
MINLNDDLVKNATSAHAEQIGDALAIDFANLIVLDTPDIAADITQRLRAFPSLKTAVIYNNSDSVIFKYSAIIHKESIDVENDINDSVNYMTPIYYSDSHIGKLHINLSIQKFDSLSTDFTAGLIVMTPFMLITALILAMIAQRLLSKPIEEFSSAMSLVTSEKSYNMQFGTDDRGEFAVMYHGLNTLLDTVNQTQLEYKTECEKAKSANHAKSQFVARMSHEIRTPLNALLNLNELMLQTELSNEQNTFLTSSLYAAKSLKEIVDDILDFSKIEAGEMNVCNTDFNPAQMIENIAILYFEQAREKGLEFNAYIEPSMNAEWIADEKRIRQVVTNLVSNAIKYTKSGMVAIEATLEQENPEKPMLNVAVIDTGIGISDSFGPSLFKEFSQAEDSYTRSNGGTGLGLAICKRLVSMMGGSINYNSKDGAGSKFIINIPLKHSINTTDSAEGFKSPGQQRSLLLIEPNKVTRKYIGRQLSSYNFKVKTYGNPAEIPIDAIKYADLVLASYRLMPDETSELRGMLPKPDIFFSYEERKYINNNGKNIYRGTIGYPFKNAEILNALSKDAKRTPHLIALDSQKKIPIEENAPQKILLVEDSPSNQLVISTILTKSGYDIDVASDGFEAVDKALHHKYQLILMDISMPGRDGIETTKIIRDNTGPNQSSPIIALTANVYDDDKQRCFEAGMNGFLTKPVKNMDMLNYIRDVLQKDMGSDVISEMKLSNGA